MRKGKSKLAREGQRKMEGKTDTDSRREGFIFDVRKRFDRAGDKKICDIQVMYVLCPHANSPARYFAK